MPCAVVSANEDVRVAELHQIGVLDTERSPDFDIFPELARHFFSVPIAAISLVDTNRQWFKASVGLDALETSRDHSFCAHAILNPDEILYVPDATKDARFADNELVVGEFGLRFYAGMPVLGAGGHPLGAICLMDRVPRTFNAGELDQLKQLAIGVGSALKLHSSLRELRQLVTSDPLTGLGNRIAFDERLKVVVDRSNSVSGAHAGLLFLDLDGFKAINDLFGHGGGDAALQEVAARLRQVSVVRDVAYRFGGDEFCLLLDDISGASELMTLAAHIHAALATTFMIDGKVVPLRTSIGIAVCPDDESDPVGLVRSADAALYEAKRAGRGTTRLAASPKNTKVVSRLGRNELQDILREALLPPGHEPFTLELQPIFSNKSGSLTGFEALARWPRPDGRMIMPSEFVPVAESTGLIVQLNRWVLDKACALAATWPDHLTVSSNLSAADFFAGDLVRDVCGSLKRHGLSPHRLKLEITETVMLCEPVRVRTSIRRLRDLGVQTVIDDFGAGYTSISYLRDFDVGGLKIDGSFTTSVDTNPRSLVFVQAITDMASALGIETTVEGIETAAQLRLICDMKIGLMQGYLLGRPMAPDKATEMITRAGSGMSNS